MARDAVVRLSAHVPLPDHRQGNSNGCGTTSLAMILSGLGHLTDRKKIDEGPIQGLPGRALQQGNRR